MNTEAAAAAPKRLPGRPKKTYTEAELEAMEIKAMSKKPIQPKKIPEIVKDLVTVLKEERIEVEKTRDEKKDQRLHAKRHLKREFELGQRDLPAPVDEREAYRSYILSLSLFPNLHNYQNIMTNLPAS